MKTELLKIFSTLPLPVIICRKENRRVLFANSEVRFLTGRVAGRKNRLEDILHSLNVSDLPLFWNTLDTKGSVENFTIDILGPQKTPVTLALYAQTLSLGENGDDIVVLSCLPVASSPYAGLSHEDAVIENELVLKILTLAYHSSDIDRTVNEVLQTLGSLLHVDRTYIFETTPRNTITNTYEWCAPGVKSQIDFCQDFPHDSIPWEEIQNGLYVAENIQNLSEKERLFLEPQGIQAIIILPFFIDDRPVGFVGCDECNRPRVWTRLEMQVVRSSVAIVSTLLSRKRAQQELQRYQEMLRTVLDNIREVIYVSDFETHELLFANKYLKETLVQGENSPLPEVEGQPCWRALQQNQGPCSFCPKPQLLNEKYLPTGPHTWEHENSLLGRWFLVTDSAIRWVDGRYVHMESARDITDLKQKEKELREKAGELRTAASTDALTGIYNRQMGSVLLEEAHKRVLRTRRKSTLCFLDLDGLKHVNDTLGHREGDRMLIAFSEIVRQVIRNADIFCRWGGDEFILFLENCSPSKAETFAIRRINSRVEKHNKAAAETTETPGCFLSFSYGLEEFSPDGGLTLEQIIAAADQKMYDNKTAKKRSQARNAATPEHI